MTLPSYLKRQPYFSQRFIRLMVKTAAAQTIGTDAFALLAVIVTTEDARRYTGPVAYYNEQLMPLLGFGSRKRLVAARDKAVGAGWLFYSPGSKGVAGLYFVNIPIGLEQIPDGPSDESAELCRSDTELQTERQMDLPAVCRSDTELKGGAVRNGKGTPYIPSPIPNPKETRSRQPSFDAAQVELPSELDTDAFRAAWSDWCKHRREIRKPLTKTCTAKQLRLLAKWGVSRSVVGIDHSICNGWTGIHEPAINGKPASDKPRPEHRHFTARVAL